MSCSNKIFLTLCGMLLLLAGLVQSGSAQQAEADLLAVLRSEAPASEKAITCKRLAVYGTESSVSELAKLLADPQLSSWARIALEAIPGDVPEAALRDAAKRLDGLLLVGVLNSLGVRRDKEAVELLIQKVGSDNAEVIAAAISALGQIGTPEAAASLRLGLGAQVEPRWRADYAEAAVVCAERLLAAGQSKSAQDLYELVRQADVPLQRRLEATRGVILTSGEDGFPLLAECLLAAERPVFQLGLTVARELPGPAVTRLLTETLAKVAPERGALLVLALADQPGLVDLGPLNAAAQSGAKPVRLAALAVLSRLGDASSLEPLMSIAGETDAEIAVAARDALAALPGEGVNQRVASLMGTAAGPKLQLLVELVGRRRIPATNDLLRVLDSRDSALRQAALYSLGETVELQELPLLVERACDERTAAGELEVVRKALKAASVRMPDREACAGALAQALSSAPESAQVFLVETLGDVGGQKALATIVEAAKSDSAALQDAGSRLLGKWSELADAETLLDYARTGPTNQFRIRALKGYLALARRFAMPEPDRVKMCRSALELTKQPGDRKLVLDVLKLHPSPDAFVLAAELAEAAELKSEATEVVATIVQKLGGQGIDVERLKSLFSKTAVKLEILEARYGAGDTWQDVTAVMQKHSGDLPWVSLPSTNYNQSFGGDPAPGVAKQLRVKYRLNGKEGEVSLAENALILIPTPKQ